MHHFMSHHSKWNVNRQVKVDIAVAGFPTLFGDVTSFYSCYLGSYNSRLLVYYMKKTMESLGNALFRSIDMTKSNHLLENRFSPQSSMKCTHRQQLQKQIKIPGSVKTNKLLKIIKEDKIAPAPKYLHCIEHNLL